MTIKILAPLWGHEHLGMKAFLHKIKASGYDGIDSWIPRNKNERTFLFNFLQQQQMYMVAHQHAADGSTFKKFKASFLENLKECALPEPLLINSHTGRDYFSFQQNLELIDIAQHFSARTGILVVHETHRGRLGYCPQMIKEFFEARPGYFITADFSHWVCVTESMLENFTGIVNNAINRTRHVHARIGHEQGPQVGDPRAPEWEYALNHFLGWWDKMVAANIKIGSAIFTFTTEFGPAPYMPAIPFKKTPLSNQYAVNCFMKNLLKERYQFF